MLAPVMSPTRRPTIRISNDAGTVDSAMPTIAIETGSVAHEALGESFALKIPPNKTTAVSPEPVSTWAAKRMRTFDMDTGRRTT
jgi:hypothetical protein